MKKIHPSLRFVLLAGLTAGLALQPLSPLRADDHGGTSSHGGDDHGGTGGTGGQGGDDDGGTTGGGDDHGGTTGGDDHGGGSQTDDHGKIEFLGTIQALPATADFTGIWTVDGRAVTVDAATLIRTEHGAPTVGGKAEVEGILAADGSSVQASVVKTEDAAMECEDNVVFGVIQSLPATGIIGTWQVSGLTVLVSDTTRVETEGAAPAVGATVRVEGVQQADASIVASEIEVQAADDVTTQNTKNVKLKGTITQLPATPGAKGNWVIDGVVVTVTDDSARVAGSRKAKVGRKAVIKGQQQINGSILAHKVSIPRKSH